MWSKSYIAFIQFPSIIRSVYFSSTFKTYHIVCVAYLLFLILKEDPFIVELKFHQASYFYP